MTNEQLRTLQDLEEQYSFNAYVLISALVKGEMKCLYQLN